MDHVTEIAARAGRPGYGSGYLFGLRYGDSVDEIARTFSLTREEVLFANPDRPRAWGPKGETFERLGVGEVIWLPPHADVGRALGVGALEPQHCGGGQVAEFHPEAWDWDACTYQIQSGDDAIGLVNLYSFCCEPGLFDCGPNGSPTHFLNQLNPNASAMFAAGEGVLQMPKVACDNAKKLDCPAGFTKGSDGRCVAGSAPPPPPTSKSSSSGGGGLLLGLLAVGIIGAVALASSKKEAA